MPELRKALMRFDACILATKLPQMPDGLLQEMLCDADLYHLGTLDFFACDVLMKKETELTNPEPSVPFTGRAALPSY